MPTGDEMAIIEKQARLDAESIAEQANLARQQAESIAQQERQQKEKLVNYLRSLGVNPDEM